jgi:hypothetical protein
VDLGQAGQRAQRAAAERQYLGAPWIVDYAAQRTVEVGDDQEWPAREVVGRGLDRRLHRDGCRHSAAYSSAAGDPSGGSDSCGVTVLSGMGVPSATNSGTTVVIAPTKISSGAPP